MAEDHDIAGILALTTEDVRAMPMDLDRRGIKGVLWRTFKYYGPMKILYPRPNIELNEAGNQASARVPFLIVKKSRHFQALINCVMTPWPGSKRSVIMRTYTNFP